MMGRNEASSLIVGQLTEPSDPLPYLNAVAIPGQLVAGQAGKLRQAAIEWAAERFELSTPFYCGGMIPVRESYVAFQHAAKLHCSLT